MSNFQPYRPGVGHLNLMAMCTKNYFFLIFILNNHLSCHKKLSPPAPWFKFWLLHIWYDSMLMCLGKPWKMAQVFEPLCPCGRPRKGSWLLASAWLLKSFGKWISGWTDSFSLSLSHRAFMLLERQYLRNKQVIGFQISGKSTTYIWENRLTNSTRVGLKTSL